MNIPGILPYTSAVNDFHKARRQAELEKLAASLTGKSPELFSYEDVRKKLRAVGSADRGIQEIPVDAIIGSLGRYSDFTRNFLPTQDDDASRWARVKLAMTEGSIPPIEVYKIGEAYFVKDGNHRVSVAQQLDMQYIEAYVTEVHTEVPFSPETQPDDLIVKAEYAEFLKHTLLKDVCPEADLSVTVPGKYCMLEEHIAVHRYFMGIEQQREIPYQEAVAHWYDTVYLPVIQIIQSQGILRHFPDRTETDLYLWLAEHRAALQETLGWEIKAEVAAADLAETHTANLIKTLARIGGKILDAVMPEELEAGPAPGKWREERLPLHRKDCLFSDILVAIDGYESGWRTLEQALEIARCEGSQLHGLHIVPTEEDRESSAAQSIKAEFERRCAQAGIPGKLAIETGQISTAIKKRAHWTDLVVLSLSHPPGDTSLDKLRSGFRTLVQSASRPMLAVPCPIFPLERALLAYDGSPKAREALFIATYLGTRWTKYALTVLTVAEGSNITDKTLLQAQEYLEGHGVAATYILEEQKTVAEAILETAATYDSNLVIMGGYGNTPVLEVVFSSALNQVLRESQRPILICR